MVAGVAEVFPALFKDDIVDAVAVPDSDDVPEAVPPMGDEIARLKLRRGVLKGC